MNQPGLLELADGLYALPLAEFTPARDALAHELKVGDSAAGLAPDKELAARVKALRRPTLAAWVVNLLVRREADQVDQILAVGAALREAQRNADGEELRTLTRQRRQLTAAVTTRSRALAAQHGQRISGPVAEQVEDTLTAALLDDGVAAALRSGLLVTALSATGVEEVAVTAAVAVPEALGFRAHPRADQPADSGAADPAGSTGTPGLRLIAPDEREQRLAALATAREELATAEESVADGQRLVDKAASQREKLQARALQLQSELEELNRRLSELEERAETVDDQLQDVEADHARAVDELADRLRDRETAAEQVERAAAAAERAGASQDS